jgi:vacuolar protein sorting-associated protein 13A/C
MGATAGIAYTDMNVVDIQVNLTVGCIEVVFVTKFIYSILVSISMIYSFILVRNCCIKHR